MQFEDTSDWIDDSSDEEESYADSDEEDDALFGREYGGYGSSLMYDNDDEAYFGMQYTYELDCNDSDSSDSNGW